MKKRKLKRRIEELERRADHLDFDMPLRVNFYPYNKEFPQYPQWGDKVGQLDLTRPRRI